MSIAATGSHPIEQRYIKELFDDFFSLLEQPAQISMPMGATSEDRSLTLKRFYQSEFLSPLMQLAARFKNASFEAENEWRLISQTKFNGGAICLREGPFTLIPYVVLKLAEKGEALAIHTICVGPTPYRELAINAVKRLFPVQNAPVWQMSKTTFRPDW